MPSICVSGMRGKSKPRRLIGTLEKTASCLGFVVDGQRVAFMAPRMVELARILNHC